MSLPLQEVIFEKKYQGLYLKVTAIDVCTGQEASVVGPAHKGAEIALEKLALKKLTTALESFKEG